MYLQRSDAPFAPDIGRASAARSHDRPHAVRKIEEMINGDKTLAEEIELSSG